MDAKRSRPRRGAVGARRGDRQGDRGPSGDGDRQGTRGPGDRRHRLQCLRVGIVMADSPETVEPRKLLAGPVVVDGALVRVRGDDPGVPIVVEEWDIGCHCWLPSKIGADSVARAGASSPKVRRSFGCSDEAAFGDVIRQGERSATLWHRAWRICRRESERRDRAMIRRGTQRGIIFPVGSTVAWATVVWTYSGVEEAIEEGWSRSLEAGSAAPHALADGMLGGFLAVGCFYAAWRLGRRLPPLGKEDDELHHGR